MKRAEIWTVSAGGFGGKPRPAVVIQSDHFDATASITICPLTSDATEASLFRLVIEPSQGNGLHSVSRLMVDKIVTVPKEKLGKKLGQLNADEVARLDRAIVIFLDLA
jgi:mRNA interferase MazF